MATHPPVSIVLASVRDALEVEETLASIGRSAAAYPGAVELVLVRDTESDDHWRRFEQWELDLVVLFTGRHSGSAVSRYLGMRAARFDVVLFTDDDVLVGRNWIDRMSAAVVRHGTCAGAIRSRTKGFWENCDEQIDNYRIHARDGNGQLKFVSFPVFGVNRDLVPEPPFEISTKNKADDTEFACVLRLAGVSIHLEESIEVSATYPSTYRAFLARKYRHGIGIGRLRARLGRRAWARLELGSLSGLFLRWLRLSAELGRGSSLHRRALIVTANLVYCVALVGAAATYRVAARGRRPRASRPGRMTQR